MDGYVELHCHSNFSLLDGASTPEALVERAAALKMPAFALTDHNAVYGAVPFVKVARHYHVRPIFGAEMTLEDGAHLTLLVESEIGWRNLCQLITLAQHQAPKGQAVLKPEWLRDHTAGIIALSGCYQGAISNSLRRKDYATALATANEYRELFGPDNFWIELQHHLLPEDKMLISGLVKIAQDAQIRYVATNNVHYALRGGHQLQSVLTCIKYGLSWDEAVEVRYPNSEYYLKSAAQMRPLFAEYPDALTNTLVIAERCQFDLRYGLQDLPQFPTPHALTAHEYLGQLCTEAMPTRYCDASSSVWDRLNYELAVIERACLSNYFLIVWDIIQYARKNGIRCQGRGSAANSLVAYLLGISPIDPLAHDLVFERFLSDERQLMPDIDIDFQADRREEVIQYVYGRYGLEHSAMACTYVTYRTRSAIRDIGKVLGIPTYLVDQVAKTVDYRDPNSREALRQVLGADSDISVWQHLFDLCQSIRRFPRHLGIHNGGMVITGPPIMERVPTEPASMPDRVVIQWDKDHLEDVGLVKIDLLGLRMLSAIAETLDHIEQTTGSRPDIDHLTFDDPAIYDMITKGDTIGIFQVESRAQTQILPRLKPCCFNDLIVAVSLIRPGPIQGNMVHPYLRRRMGQEPVHYPHPSLEKSLRDTLGVILFQEQVLKVARDLAGLSPGKGEILRRALGSKDGGTMIDELHQDFIEGAMAREVSPKVAEDLFASLRSFGGYSFPKSHAAAFAVIVYQSAWLKYYFPSALFTSLLNHQPMGFWSPSVLIGDARRRGIKTLPVEVSISDAKCRVEGNHIRLGFQYIKGMGQGSIQRLLDARCEGQFKGLADLCRRSRLPRKLIENLILAGAMDTWNLPRRKLLWELGKLRYQAEEFDDIFSDDGVMLPSLGAFEQLAWEHEIMGLSTGNHLLRFYRNWLQEHGFISSTQLKAAKPDEIVRVAGLVVVHQAPPTAKGIHFLTLEDEEGLMDVIVYPNIYERFSRVLRSTALILVVGKVQQDHGVVNVLAGQMAAIPQTNPELFSREI